MSEKKEYSPIEVAQEIAKRISSKMKKYEESLEKSKNSAHEIDAGEEPKNDDAECPESLCESSASSEGSQESSSEEQAAPKSEDSEEKEGSEESEEKESEEESEEEYEFKKSESGMHTVEYKTMAKSSMKKAKIDDGMRATDKKKARADRKEGYKPHQKEKVTADGYREFKPGEGQANLKERLKNKPKMPSQEDLEYPMAASEEGKINPSFDRENKDKEWTKDQRKEIDRTKPGKTKSSRNDQAKYIEEAKKRREAYRNEGVLKAEVGENKVEETKGIDLDKERESDKDKENFKRPMEKGGEKEEKCCCEESPTEKVGVEKLKKFLGKKKQPSPGMVKEPQE